MFKFLQMPEASIRRAYLAAFAVIAFQLFTAAKAIVVVPMVDGWAVWNRVMQLDFREISWAQYLFTPHGAHPHSIVYLIAWIDAYWGGAQQYVMATVSFVAIAGCAMFAVKRVVFWASAQGWRSGTKILAAAAAAALVTNLADSETLMQPFQVVMSASRLAYLLLLWYLIKTLRQGAIRPYLVIIVLASTAVTFHGSGYIFAAVFLLVHVFLASRWWMALGAVLPAIVAIAYQARIAAGGGELSHLGALLSADKILAFLKGLCAYFGTPLGYLLPSVGDVPLLLAGATVASVTAAVTIFCMIKSMAARVQPSSRVERDDTDANELVFAWVIGLFILLSGAAAAAVWIVRSSGQSGFCEPYICVLTSARYGAYSSLAYVLLTCTVLQLARKFLWTNRLAPMLPIALIALAMYPAITLKDYYRFDDDLNIATAGLAVGLPPTYPETEAVWPAAKEDWYWVNALPQTVAYLHDEKKGPWRTLPELHAIGDSRASYLSIHRNKIRPVQSDPDKKRCHISGTVSTSQVALSTRSVLTPVVNEAEEVIGYAVLTRRSAGGAERELEGFVFCDAVSGFHTLLHISPGSTAWSPQQQVEVVGAAPYNLTDQTWINGVARNWAGFFLPDTPSNRGIFVTGRILRFDDGHIRTIIKQETANGFLNIFLNGPVMDGNMVGYPHLIRPLN
jgi:hypothetical protein